MILFAIAMQVSGQPSIQLGTPAAAALYEEANAASDRWAECLDEQARILAKGDQSPSDIADAVFGLCKQHEMAMKKVMDKAGGDPVRRDEIWHRRISAAKASMREVTIGTVVQYRTFAGH